MPEDEQRDVSGRIFLIEAIKAARPGRPDIQHRQAIIEAHHRHDPSQDPRIRQRLHRDLPDNYPESAHPDGRM